VTGRQEMFTVQCSWILMKHTVCMPLTCAAVADTTPAHCVHASDCRVLTHHISDSGCVFFSNIRSIRGIRSTSNLSISNPRKTLRVLNQIQICSETSEKHLTSRWDFC